MLPVKLGGLPAHILLVHAVIVFVPLAALALVASAVWPAARAKLGFLTPAAGAVALVFLYVAMNAGKWLRDHLQGNIGHTNPLIIRHTHIAYDLWPWVLAMFVMSVVVWVLGRRYDMPLRPSAATARPSGQTASVSTETQPVLPIWATALVAAVSIAVSVVAIIQLYRVGEAGSKAVWNGLTTG